MSRPNARGTSWLRDLPLLGWLVAALIVALVHRSVPDANWLMLHLVLLGALSHSIVVWSFHFSQTLLRSPASDAEAGSQGKRLGLLTVGAVAVVIGVPTLWWPLTLAGGLVVASAIGWHAVVLWRMMRRALPRAGPSCPVDSALAGQARPQQPVQRPGTRPVHRQPRQQRAPQDVLLKRGGRNVCQCDHRDRCGADAGHGARRGGPQQQARPIQCCDAAAGGRCRGDSRSGASDRRAQ